MTPRLLLLAVVLALAGCVSEPPPATVPKVSGADYDRIWQATREVIQKRFDVFAAKKEEGTIVTDFKRSEPFPALWAKDSQNTYDTLEEEGYIVRRKVIAVISKSEDGQYEVNLTVLRERQAYAPPDVVYTTTYSLYEARVGGPGNGVRYDPNMTWTRLPDDTWLEARMMKDIQTRLGKPVAQKTPAPAAPAPGPAPSK